MPTETNSLSTYAGILGRTLVNFISGLWVVKTPKNFFQQRAQKRFYSDYFSQNALVFDVGACVGSKTDIFLQMGCTVVSVEPQPKLAQDLRAKYSDTPNVFVEEVGLGEKEGTANINISSKYPGFSSFNESWQEGTKYHTFDSQETVTVITLDMLIKKYGLPHFCKIDVEGSEPKVLAGLSMKIPLLCFEFHSDDPALIEVCLSLLQARGYREFNFVIAENPYMALSGWVSADMLSQKIKESEYAGSASVYGDIYAR